MTSKITVSALTDLNIWRGPGRAISCLVQGLSCPTAHLPTSPSGSSDLSTISIINELPPSTHTSWLSGTGPMSLHGVSKINECSESSKWMLIFPTWCPGSVCDGLTQESEETMRPPPHVQVRLRHAHLHSSTKQFPPPPLVREHHSTAHQTNVRTEL